MMREAAEEGLPEEARPAGGHLVALIENRAKEVRQPACSLACRLPGLQGPSVCLAPSALRLAPTAGPLQVGLAALELETMTLSLLQYVEFSRGYAATQ